MLAPVAATLFFACAAAQTDPALALLLSAEQKMKDGLFDAAEADSLRAAELAKNNLKRRIAAEYSAATAMAFRGKLDGSAAIFANHIAATAQHPDLEFWAHNQLTWVRYDENDLAGALVEADQQRVTAMKVKNKKDRLSLLLHALWDKAYLLRELATKQPKDSQAPTLQYALAAKAEYEKASPKDEGVPIIEAWFAICDGDGAAARKAIEKVDYEKRDDVQDLWIIWRALKAGGDDATAQKVAAMVQSSKNMYLGLAIYRPRFKE
jgi:hypothetical protein